MDKNSSRAKKLIILVDDELNIHSMIKRALKDLDLEILSFVKPSDVLESLKTSKPDLIILDIDMPEMNGYQLIKEVGNMKIDQIPYLILTKLDTEESLVTSYLNGASLFLEKPFKAEKLYYAVRYLIDDLPPNERLSLEYRL